MAFPTTAALDTFNRANGALGANWTANPTNDGSAAFTIISNAAQGAAATDSGDASYYNVATYGPNAEAWVDLPTGPNGFFELSVFLRIAQPSAVASTADGYQVFITGTAAGASYAVDLSIYRIDNAVQTELGSTQTGLTFTAGNGFGASVRGSTIQAFSGTGASWPTFGDSRTDATYTSAGYIGMTLFESFRTATINNFGGGVALATTDGEAAASMFARRRRRSI